MCFHQGFRHAVLTGDRLLRRFSSHVRGNRQKTDEDENHEARPLHFIIFCGESNEEQTQPDAETDGWKVVQQEVQMGQRCEMDL